MKPVNGGLRKVQNIPALMICYNRLDYTKQAFEALKASDCGTILLVDNGSTDGTRDWAMQQVSSRVLVSINQTGVNTIANAMNHFLHTFKNVDYCIKVDNDTIIPPDFCALMFKHMAHADIVQAKHYIIPETHTDGWAGFTKHMTRKNGLLYHHFVGGSGIMFKRSVITTIPETDWAIGGWRAWQRRYPDIKKGFCEDVKIKLLDEHGYGDYPEYYKQTGRL